MSRYRHAGAALATAVCLALSQVALSAPPLVTVRVTSIDAALRDVEVVAKSAHEPITRAGLLKELAGAYRPSGPGRDRTPDARFIVTNDAIRPGETRGHKM